MKKLLLLKNSLCIVKRNFTALLIVLCGLFANTAMSQVATTYTWTGATNNDWATTTNWSPTNGTLGNTPGANAADIVVISNGGNPTLSSGTVVTIRRLTITNATGPESGSTLTIDDGAILNVTYTNNQLILLNGGNIVNNGTLSLDNSAYIAATTQTVALLTPTVLPASPTEYGYSGSGTLNINLSGAGKDSSAAFTATSNNANTTYRLNFTENKTTITLASNIVGTATSIATSYVVRATNVSPVIIGGTGYTLGTAESPVNGGLIVMGPANTPSITVETGTVLTLNSASTNTSDGINIINSNALGAANTFTNKGTINILGATTKSGLYLSPTAIATPPVINFENQGIINVDITANTANGAALQVANVGTAGTPGTVNITNAIGAEMTLKNNQAQATNIGSAIRIFSNANTANVNFNNNGTLNINGTRENFGGQIRSIVTNNGLITSNQEFSTMEVLNNSSKKISFVKDAATLASTNALTTGLTFTTNNGIIETATGATQLNNLAGVTALSATSSIEPGGSAGKGIASFSASSFPILGTLKLDVAGNTAAGTDYDQVNNVLADGGFDVTGATLDVTGMSSAASPVDIIVANGAGTITGTFTTVTGLESGWSVNYGVAGKVQLVNPSLKVIDSEFNKNSVAVYKNNGTLYINSGAVAINNIKVYDLLGRMIVEQKDVKANTASINNLKAMNQVLIVKISGEDNAQVTKKVMF